MANRYFDRERYGRGYEEDERYGRSSDYERYNQAYAGEPYYRGYGNYYYGNQYGEPGMRTNEGRDRDAFYRNRRYGGFNRGWEDQSDSERGFWERAGDEVRSWFGDEEAERRRQQDEMRSQYAGRGPKGYRRSDERIREDVNERLTGDYYLDAHDVDVSVNEGIVTLSGRVDNRRDKRRAENLAESVTGVTDVYNQLRIGNSESATTGEPIGTARARAAKP